MAEAKLAPNLPQWVIDHANRYIYSGGSEGHIYTVTPPGYSEMHVPSLLLTTTSTRAGIGTSSPIPRSRFRWGRKRPKLTPGRPPAQSANAFGKRH